MVVVKTALSTFSTQMLFPMKKALFILFLFSITLVVSSALYLTVSATTQNSSKISGTILQGYRVLTVSSTSSKADFTVYRGDYLKFSFDDNLTPPTLSIPSLSISKNLVGDLQAAPYFKMKKTGQYPYSLGQVTGLITVIEYAKPQYRTVTSGEAADLIASASPPVILDVRTKREYSGGHLKNSIHIPVQEIQRRYGELSAYKNADILIYCATGNRSTVAAKILIDNGFTQIYNMREGVHVWAKNGYPLVR